MKNISRIFRMSILCVLIFIDQSLFAQEIVQVGAGEYFTSYRTNNGRLMAVKWGASAPAVFDLGISNVVDVDGAQYTNIALTSSGEVYVVGVSNSVNGYANHVPKDNLGNSFTGNTKVYGFYQCYLTIRSGKVWYWGIGDVLGVNGGSTNNVPKQLNHPAGKTMVKLVTGSATSFGALTYVWGLASDGTVWQWDRSNHTPFQVTFPGNVAQDITMVGPMAFVVKTATDLFSWGYDPSYAGGRPTWQQGGVQSVKASWEAAGAVFPLKEIVGNYNTLHVIDANNHMFASGSNAQGEIGNGIEFSPWRTAGTPWNWNWSNGQMMTAPVQIPGKFKNITSSNTITFYHYVQDMGNNWYSWGRNKAMSLGNGKTLSINDYAIYPEALNVPAPTMVKPLTQTWSVSAFNPNAAPAPLSNAGVNQYINSNSTTLYGSGSSQQDGAITTYFWKQTSGSATSIASPNAKNTNVTGLTNGTYVYQLTVTNNKGVTASSTVTVVVSAGGTPTPPPSNNPPVANAGNDILISLPESTTNLEGTGADSDGSITSYSWTKISGANGGNLSNSSAARTSVTSLTQGVYSYVLTVTDNAGATARDTVKITVLKGSNNAPIAQAGPDKAITLPVNTTSANGSGTDSDGTILTYQWRKASGPTTGNIVSPSSSTTNFTNLVQGTYLFELTVEDNVGAIGKDTMRVIVNAAKNTSPVVNAGTDIIVTLPLTVSTLRGSASDPDGSIVAYSWTKTSGPSAVITNPSLVQTSISGLQEGVYIFTLTATDNLGATASDDIQVTVKAATTTNNQGPWANAGTDKTITLPMTSVQLQGWGMDPDGTVVAYRWTVISGPRTSYFRFSNQNSGNPRVYGLGAGTYRLRLTITDNRGAQGSDEMILKVNPRLQAKQGVDTSSAISGEVLEEETMESKTKETEINNGIKLSVFPNPVQSSFTAKITGFEKDINVDLTIVDQKGSPVIRTKFTSSGGENLVKMNADKLAPGIYYLRAQSSNHKVVAKLVKGS